MEDEEGKAGARWPVMPFCLPPPFNAGYRVEKSRDVMVDNHDFSKPAAVPVTGRLAPSPTGFLHLGNAWSFLCAWLGARKQGGTLILRIEDIDPQRSRSGFVDALCEDLRWLGLDWDYGPGASVGPVTSAAPSGPFWQSLRHERYEKALRELTERGSVYQCFCTRKELRSMAGAPQAGDAAEAAYSGSCRDLSAGERAAKLAQGRHPSLRLRFEEHLGARRLKINDLVYGPVGFTPEQAGGDFALRRSDGVFAYQLAVVLDDIAMGVTQVVRGADILSSTPRQLLLYELFAATPPVYAHVPLLLDHDGERLAKRHASLSLRGLRAAGVSPESLIGFLAEWGGLSAGAGRRSASDLLPEFDFSRIRKEVAPLPVDIVERLKVLK